MAVTAAAIAATAASVAASGYSMSQGTPDYGKAAREAEEQRRQAVTQGQASVNKAFSQFNPAFYNQRTNAYVNYAMPQLADQYRQTKNSALFGLANQGLAGSSVAEQRQSDINRQLALSKQQIYDTGRSQSQQLQGSVEGARQNILNQLYQSADPANAKSAAIASASGFSAPSVFQPLGNMFSNLAQQYYTNQLLAAAPQTGTGWYGPYQGYNPNKGVGGLGALPPVSY